jgi:hypothetical protein
MLSRSGMLSRFEARAVDAINEGQTPPFFLIARKNSLTPPRGALPGGSTTGSCSAVVTCGPRRAGGARRAGGDRGLPVVTHTPRVVDRDVVMPLLTA